MTTSDPKRPDSAEPAPLTEPSLADRIEELAARVEREAAAAGTGGQGASAAQGVPGSVASGADLLASLLTEMRQDVSELRGVLEARIAVLEDSLDGVADRLEALARDGASTTGEGLTGLATDVRALDARLAGIGGLPAVTAADLAGIAGVAAGQDSLADAVSDALNDLADAVGESLTALGATMAGSVEETKALIAASAESGNATAEAVSATADAASAAAEAASLAAEAASVAAEAAAVAAEGATAALKDRPIQAPAQDPRPATPPGPTAASLVNAAVADIRAGHGEDLTALRSDLADALDEVLDRVNLAAEDSSQRLIAAAEVSTAEHQELVFRADGASRAAAAEAEVLLTEITRNGGLLATMQADIQAQRLLNVSVVEEARTAVARVDETLGGVAGALVRYLAERDRLVEAERIELLREVFTELATSMTPANRRKLASRVSDALNRRHDARDAERWRERGPKAVAPAPVEIQDVEELGALLDRHTDSSSDKGTAGAEEEGVPVRAATRALGGAATIVPGIPVKAAPTPTPTRTAKANPPAVRTKPAATSTGPAKAVTKASGAKAAAAPVAKSRKAPSKTAASTAGAKATTATVAGSAPVESTTVGSTTGGSTTVGSTTGGSTTGGSTTVSPAPGGPGARGPGARGPGAGGPGAGGGAARNSNSGNSGGRSSTTGRSAAPTGGGSPAAPSGT